VKKIFLILIFMLFFSKVVFGTEELFRGEIWTSEGLFFAMMDYVGKNVGQELASGARSLHTPTTRISNGRWEAINNLLNRYRHSAGDTYIIQLFSGMNWPPISLPPSTHHLIIVEYTSSTRYNWWAFFNASF